MSMTAGQLQTLRTAIDADAVLVAFPLTTDGYIDLAAKLNTEQASPDFYVWRESVSRAEIMQNGFDWVRVDNLSVGKARIWEWLFEDTNAINPSKPNVRAGIVETWKGTAADLAVQAAVFAHCKRLAKRVEKIFAGASVTPPDQVGAVGAVGNPATVVVASVTRFDVEAARAL